MTNRLADATSPYLLQHADNPVDWWPWSPEAFAEATNRDVPVLLSVGYAACHWCHVMAHESFENPALAAVINAGFVPVKVDREERPDVDAVYMTATQAMTGQGGWPMTVFLTPDGRPFYAGTYYPPEPRGGLPGFGQLLEALAGAWQDQRSEVLESASTITAAIAATAETVTGDAVPVRQWPAVLDAAAATLLADYDAARGGFGRAPKFPPAMACQFLLRYHRRTGDPDALAAVEGTLTAMAGGGLYDQLAGGFARYSVDAGWVVPHFEKMLYDNALLLRCYAEHARTTGSPASRRVCEETVDFLLDRLRLAGGGFAASLDADTAGVEGLTYVWSPAELAEILGPLDGAWVAELCEVTAAGTFEHATSVLQLRREPDDPRRWAECRRRLLAARDARPQPALDDKVLLSWNGLAIGALAEAGAVLDRPDWVAAARAAADDVASRHLVDGRWRRASRHGRPADAQATLADLADLADGLLALHQACGERWYLDLAGDLLDLALARFADPAGGFFDTSDDAERLVVRPRDVTDGAAPAGASGLVRALLTHSALTGVTEHRTVADRELSRMLPLLGRFPRSAGHWLTAAEEALTGPVQVAVVGPDAAALLRVARAAAPAGTVFAVGDGTDDRGLELLQGRGAAGRPALAFVCHGFVCALPTADPAELAIQLRG